MFKRALVAASVVAAFAAPAMADATVYGSIRAGVETGRDSVLSKTTVVDQSSRIGFKGSDKIEGGAKVVFKAESSVRTDDSGSTWGGRDTYIGIEDAKLGSLYVGKQLDAYADWTGPINIVLDDAMINSEDLATYKGDRLGKVVKYVSPSFGGLKVEASFNTGAKTTATNNTTAAALLSWTNDVISTGVAYSQENDVGAVNDAKKKMMVAGASVKMGDLTLGGHFESVKNVNTKQNDIGVGVSYVAGKYTYNALLGKLMKSETNGTKADDGATQLNLGTRYALSKQSTGFLTYTMLKNDTNGTTKTATNYGGNGGKTAHVLAVSLRTDF